ncbi:hypothetical protein STSP2_00221 [Anaerohalosphaera lusitana]|uniref:Uncharacterized protein n=1 Tax=Anaerohalosphaera lusitana TaxID=1936003 RepID=A0A1U9NGK8_9BACT|nr:DUF4173 domain-containing protein [Anaerohalosphaera lusitana]AQT67081.1 hypothetical protein STSP2_00221 [Anaerohalosphaera lusitana]
MSITLVTLGSLLIAVAWNILFWDRTYGISVPIFSAIVICVLLLYSKPRLSKAKPTLFIHLLLLIYLSVCAACYRNYLILYAAIPAVFLGLGAVAFAGQEGYAFSNFIGVFESLIKMTFAGILTAPKALGQIVNKLSRNGKASKTTLKVLVGILISIPFLAIFAGLFTSADPVFSGYVSDFFEFIWEPEIFERAAVILLMWFIFCGYLYRVAKNTSLQSHLSRTEPKRNFDGIIVFVFLIMNNLLFLGFIIIQLGYLFGGKAVIRNTSFTYAEYTHKGFYEFWAAVLLVSAIILYTEYKLRDQQGPLRQMVNFAWVALIVQTLVIIASGLKRISVYEQAYGYTYLRILVALFLLWVAGFFLLFVFKIFQKRSACWLVSAGLSLAFVFLVFVSSFSIDRYIARKNIDRYLNHGREIDMDYLSYLSTDAYPEILRLKNQAKDEHIKRSASIILRQQRETADKNLEHWASWNLSFHRVENHAPSVGLTAEADQ